MTAITLKQASTASIAVPVVAVVVVAAGIATFYLLAPVAAALLVQGGDLMAQLCIDDLGPLSVCALAAAFFLSGIAGGVSGFAFTAVAACVLWLLPPGQAIPMMILLSAFNHLLSLGVLRREIVIRSRPEEAGALPYIVGGLAGLPIGLMSLHVLPANLLTASLSVFLVVYSVLMSTERDRLRITLSGWKIAAAVGVAGGVLGGAVGLTSLIPVIYLGLRGVGKSTIRGIIPSYTLTLQLASLGILALTNTAIFNGRFWFLTAVTLPAVLLGSAAGVALYRRTSDVHFRWAILSLLTLSGISLVAKAMI